MCGMCVWVCERERERKRESERGTGVLSSRRCSRTRPVSSASCLYTHACGQNNGLICNVLGDDDGLGYAKPYAFGCEWDSE